MIKQRDRNSCLLYDTGDLKKRKVLQRNLKKSYKKPIVLILISVLLLISGSIFLGIQYMFEDLSVSTLDRGTLGINQTLAARNATNKITNIALFGVDTRDMSNLEGRSDSIIIVSLDPKNNSIKMTSILRDSYVPIEGHGNDKITHAYQQGGPALAIHTLNQVFHLDITDYAAINFAGFAKVIDEIGGVELEITNAERKQVNIYANRNGLSAPIIEQAGLVKLDGAQATAYSRIRKIDGDDVRANRQQTILEILFEQVKKTSKLKYPALVRTMMGYIETSMKAEEILSFSGMVLGDIKLDKNIVPSEAIDKATGGIYRGAWMWLYDLNLAANRLHSFIYGENLNLPPSPPPVIPPVAEPKPAAVVEPTEQPTSLPEEAETTTSQTSELPSSSEENQPINLDEFVYSEDRIPPSLLPYYDQENSDDTDN